ncbi:unnamed protein product, partial [Prorocentrum cordatum]
VLGELRRAPHPVGESLVLCSGSGGPAPPPQGPKTRTPGERVQGLISSMSTAEGREQLRAAEEDSTAHSRQRPAEVEEARELRAPPVEVLGTGQWRVRGIYEHQALKAGLRLLDEKWDDQGATEPLRLGQCEAPLLREGLFRQLLTGALHLKAIPAADVAAAQGDLEQLSLRQLLRLRVLHLDFCPSGRGADSVNTVGGAHEAFLGKLDVALFRGIGKTSLGGLAFDAVDPHKAGREAVLLTAASAGISWPQWWCWWLSDRHRAFFHVEQCVFRAEFPGAIGGVLEVTDLSRRDRHASGGGVRWLDWRVEHVHEESSLFATLPKAGLGFPEAELK